MPWLSLIAFVLTFFISKKSGASTGTAALLAAGTGIGTYYLADPSNTDNVLGWSNRAKQEPGSLTEGTKVANPPPGLGSLGSNLVTQVGETARSWGPLGTVGAVAGVGGILSGNNKLLLYGGAALLAIVLLK